MPLFCSTFLKKKKNEVIEYFLNGFAQKIIFLWRALPLKTVKIAVEAACRENLGLAVQSWIRELTEQDASSIPPLPLNLALIKMRV